MAAPQWFGWDPICPEEADRISWARFHSQPEDHSKRETLSRRGIEDTLSIADKTQIRKRNPQHSQSDATWRRYYPDNPFLISYPQPSIAKSGKTSIVHTLNAREVKSNPPLTEQTDGINIQSIENWKTDLLKGEPSLCDDVSIECWDFAGAVRILSPPPPHTIGVSEKLLGI